MQKATTPGVPYHFTIRNSTELLVKSNAPALGHDVGILSKVWTTTAVAMVDAKTLKRRKDETSARLASFIKG
jgi:hypothetical protein